jgi:hypothetical protein
VSLFIGCYITSVVDAAALNKTIKTNVTPEAAYQAGITSARVTVSLSSTSHGTPSLEWFCELQLFTDRKKLLCVMHTALATFRLLAGVRLVSG